MKKFPLISLLFLAFSSHYLFSANIMQNEITVHLIDSQNNHLTLGSLKYYEGGWQDAENNGDGTFTVSTNLNSLSYKMTYEHGSETKNHVPIATNPVVFQTENIIVELRNSLGNFIDGGTVKYYSGGWREFGITSEGIATKELLPKNYSFRMIFAYASNDKSQDVRDGNSVVFNTVNVPVELRNSQSVMIDEGIVKYYSGGWREFGIISGGIATRELLPKNYSFRMTYAFASNDKQQDISDGNSVMFNTVSVPVELRNSQNELIDEGTVKYYSGGWREFGTTSGGIAIKELLPKKYSFRMKYAYASNDKQQDISDGNPVIFNTVSVPVELRNSQNELIDEGTVKYYSGGWKEFGTTSGGVATKELLPKKYSFRMKFAYASNDKQQDISDGNPVIFNTVSVPVELRNSQNELIDEGTVKYYSGGWKEFGTTSGGVATKELLPKKYSFRMKFAYASNDKQQDISDGNPVIFNTVSVPVELRNSQNELIDEGTVKYYSGGWREFGLTSGGIAIKELLPKNYSFRMKYAYTSNDKKQDIGLSLPVVFNTVNAEVQLKNSEGALIDTGTVKYYSGGWRVFGITDVGIANKELLPKKYSFRMTYANGSNDFKQDLGEQPIVQFSTVKAQVHLKNTNGDFVDPGYVKYYSGGWREFGNTSGGIAEKELMPKNYSFRMAYNGENEDKQQDISIDPIVLFEVEGGVAIPVLTILEPGDSTSTAEPLITVSGSVDDTSSQVSINSTAVELEHDGFFTTNVTLVEGQNFITIEATNSAGTTAEIRNVLLDTTAPAITIINPPDSTTTNQATITLTGTVDGTNNIVIVTGDTVSVENGEFSKEISLSEGDNLINIFATDEVGNETNTTILVTLTINPPTLTIKEPQNNFRTTENYINVKGEISDPNAIVVINGDTINVDVGGNFDTQTTINYEINRIEILAVNRAGYDKIVKTVIKEEIITIPPDPIEIAPLLDSTVVSTLGKSTEFLYSGLDPIQTGLDQNTIDEVRVSVLRGKTLDFSGNALAGVKIEILDHPEFGRTYTRNDGWFDMVVNGGGNLTINYKKAGYFTTHRNIRSEWQNFEILDSVVLMEIDTIVTQISFTDSIEVARGSVVSDEDGTRQATVMFEQGTEATMHMLDGSYQSLSSINVRATEYSVGDLGPAAMPALLPPQSAYTYCVDLSIDEVIENGASHVSFSKPVAFYVENFIGFPTGTYVPTGYYDQQNGEWIGVENGKVIEIVNITNGLAEIDINGDGSAEDLTWYNYWNIDTKEREELANLYMVGTSLWRVELNHFSIYDLNWNLRNPDLFLSVNSPDNNSLDTGCPIKGSIIDVHNQTLGENINITGISDDLYYNTFYIKGYKKDNFLKIPITGVEINSFLGAISLEIKVAGKSIKKYYSPATNIEYEFMWDGKDVYGRQLQGRQPIEVDLS